MCFTIMPQPLFYLGTEYVPQDYSSDDSAESDSHTEASSMSEAETDCEAESVTQALHSSVTDMLPTCGYFNHPFQVPPPSRVPSEASSSNDSAIRFSENGTSISVLSFLRFYDYHDQNDENHLPGLLADRETVIIGIMFHNSIEGLHGPLDLKDLVTVLKFRNKRYDHWQYLTESMLVGGYVEMLNAYPEPNSTMPSWWSLFEKDPTGDSNAYFSELKAQLLKDLESAKQEEDEVEKDCISAKQEGDEVEEDCIFVKEESYPACLGEDKERMWVSFGRPHFSIENHEQNMLDVQRWIEDTA